MLLFVLYDKKSQVFAGIFSSETVGSAVRAVESDLAKKPTSLIASYPSDYDLYYVGEIESATGKIFFRDEPAIGSKVLDPNVKFIVNLSSLVVSNDKVSS